jgi:hypothetical protein
MTRFRRLAATAFLAALAAGPALAADTVVRQLPNGAGRGAVGVVEAGEDTEVSGPDAIYAGEGGDVFILDQVNGRVLSFDAERPDSEVRSLDLPPDMAPTDLVAVRGALFVWDGEARALEPDGPPGEARALRAAGDGSDVDEFARSALAQMGSQPPPSDTDVLGSSTRALELRDKPEPVRQFLASRGAGPVVAEVATKPGGKAARVEVRRQGDTRLLSALELRVTDRLGAVELLDIDRVGRPYLMVENIPSRKKQPATYVARFTPSGVLDGIFTLPLGETIALSRRFVTVSAKGAVFFLRTKATGIEVVSIEARDPAAKGLVEAAAETAPPPEAEPKRKAGTATAVRPVTRQQVVETALAFASIRWTVNQAAYGPDPDTACSGFRRIRRPPYIEGQMNKVVQGIPYCWGCHGSLVSVRTKLEQGVLAGNVCTRNEPRKDAAGVDCSAFVSATWGLGQHYTTMAIPTITSVVEDPWSLLPGDAFNKPGRHVILFLRFTPDRKVEVAESSPGACRGRVCRNIYPLASLLARGYTPVRFRGLAPDTAADNSTPAPPVPGKKK